eukprot:c17212_g1_i3.p1 GENE.c17212_g1_i3~~c17212_g1_i3.p1  ORF type:complete len:829 (+),score=164.04 c17212_g1_i3:152-2638(+)
MCDNEGGVIELPVTDFDVDLQEVIVKFGADGGFIVPIPRDPRLANLSAVERYIRGPAGIHEPTRTRSVRIKNLSEDGATAQVVVKYANSHDDPDKILGQSKLEAGETIVFGDKKKPVFEVAVFFGEEGGSVKLPATDFDVEQQDIMIKHGQGVFVPKPRDPRASYVREGVQPTNIHALTVRNTIANDSAGDGVLIATVVFAASDADTSPTVLTKEVGRGKEYVFPAVAGKRVYDLNVMNEGRGGNINLPRTLDERAMQVVEISVDQEGLRFTFPPPPSQRKDHPPSQIESILLTNVSANPITATAYYADSVDDPDTETIEAEIVPGDSFSFQKRSKMIYDLELRSEERGGFVTLPVVPRVVHQMVVTVSLSDQGLKVAFREVTTVQTPREQHALRELQTSVEDGEDGMVWRTSIIQQGECVRSEDCCLDDYPLLLDRITTAISLHEVGELDQSTPEEQVVEETTEAQYVVHTQVEGDEVVSQLLMIDQEGASQVRSTRAEHLVLQYPSGRPTCRTLKAENVSQESVDLSVVYARDEEESRSRCIKHTITLHAGQSYQFPRQPLPLYSFFARSGAHKHAMVVPTPTDNIDVIEMIMDIAEGALRVGFVNMISDENYEADPEQDGSEHVMDSQAAAPEPERPPPVQPPQKQQPPPVYQPDPEPISDVLSIEELEAELSAATMSDKGADPTPLESPRGTSKYQKYVGRSALTSTPATSSTSGTATRTTGATKPTPSTAATAKPAAARPAAAASKPAPKAAAAPTRTPASSVRSPVAPVKREIPKPTVRAAASSSVASGRPGTSGAAASAPKTTTSTTSARVSLRDRTAAKK